MAAHTSETGLAVCCLSIGLNAWLVGMNGLVGVGLEHRTTALNVVQN